MIKVLSVLILSTLYGCSALPELQNPSPLNTTTESQNYRYCEHCPETTELDNQVYPLLEPDASDKSDAPIIASEPIIVPESSIEPIITRSVQHVSLQQIKPKSQQSKPCYKTTQTPKQSHKHHQSHKSRQSIQCIGVNK